MERSVLKGNALLGDSSKVTNAVFSKLLLAVRWSVRVATWTGEVRDVL